jgi:hypothetical protein
MMHKLNQVAKQRIALREVEAVWKEIHSRHHPTSVAAAMASTRKVSAALADALGAGATDVQIHKAMDAGYSARRHCQSRLWRKGRGS